MTKRRSLDDTCDIFLSRRRRVHSPLANQRTTSEFSHYVPTLRAENIVISPFMSIPKPPELPDISARTLSCASAKPLPLPGSSGEVQPKSTRLVNGRCHIPRPRNPFILFRCDLVHQRKVLPRSDLDDTNISRIAGDLWRDMTAAQKKPWVDLAAQEKARHALLYPDYKYAPGNIGSKSRRAKNDNGHLDDRPPRQVSRMGNSPPDHPKTHRQYERPRPYPQYIPRRRSSSCPPPGAIEAHSSLETWAPTLISQDDIQHRPSQTVMYHSKTPPSTTEPNSPIMPPGHDPLSCVQGFDWPSLPQVPPSQQDPITSYPLPDLSQDPGSYAAVNYAFLDYKPTFATGTVDPGFTAEELKEIERLAIGTTFTDPFSNFTTGMVDNHAFSMAMPPFDCPGYSTGSTSSGTVSSN